MGKACCTSNGDEGVHVGPDFTKLRGATWASCGSWGDEAVVDPRSLWMPSIWPWNCHHCYCCWRWETFKEMAHLSVALRCERQVNLELEHNRMQCHKIQTWGRMHLQTGTNKCKRPSKATKNKHKKMGGAEMGHKKNKQDQNWDFFPGWTWGCKNPY